LQPVRCAAVDASQRRARANDTDLDKFSAVHALSITRCKQDSISKLAKVTVIASAKI